MSVDQRNIINYPRWRKKLREKKSGALKLSKKNDLCVFELKKLCFTG